MLNGLQKMEKELVIESPDFPNGGTFPVKNTHRGEESSPEFILKNLSPDCKTLAIVFDDLDHPMNHWLIWNIPAMAIIPGNMPKEAGLVNLGNAVQKTRYRGPNPPKGVRHKYQFNFYVLDCELKIKATSNKAALEKAIDGLIIQSGTLYGYFE